MKTIPSEVPDKPSSPDTSQTATSRPSLSPDAAAARYRDAYKVAAATVTIGQTLKIVAICAAGLALIVPMAGISQSIAAGSSVGAKSLLLGVIAAVAVGIPFYALGILISAIGQVLKATLDTAVHTSPFLDKSAIAEIMVRC